MRHKSSYMKNEKIKYEKNINILSRTQKIKEILKNLTGKILVISHSFIIWYITSKIINNNRWGISLDNAQLVQYVL